MSIENLPDWAIGIYQLFLDYLTLSLVRYGYDSNRTGSIVMSAMSPPKKNEPPDSYSEPGG
jgi:hypothetical protein